MSPQEPLSEQVEPLALELVNAGRRPDVPPGDVLRAPVELVVWLEDVGLAPPGPILDALRSPSERRMLLDEARRLRRDIERLLEALRAGNALPSPSLFGLNRVLEASCTSLRLLDAGGTLRLDVHEAGRRALTVLSPVAVSAARLLTETDPARLRRCAAADCGTWFVDTSKAGRRRWCSMARCGNRAKAARHRRRARQA